MSYTCPKCGWSDKGSGDTAHVCGPVNDVIKTSKITAKEANELVETSNKVLEERVETVCKSIREQAMLGNKELMLYSYKYGNAKWLEVAESSSYRAPEFSPVQKLVVKALERLGFTVEIHTYDITIGGGFGDPDPGRPGVAHAIRVRW